MTRPHTPRDGGGRTEGTTRRLPATTQRIPVAPTQQIPVRTEVLPESPQDGPTRAMRQVRARTEEGDWPAIPMLPVIRPEESDPISETERARGNRGVREAMDRLGDPQVPAWPQREEPDEEFRNLTR
ncbi:hypothetical protein [Pseudonocardia sp. HH130630-07]|uniref:hypothetical protein n=1 Tax=Pseudonocardia sp. HH130630-07 TaxID=1690815 RepID=UPI0008151D25|nr:hypothetical protein [Pseudonocardia sp. HH130630-07]ANY05394.1 hypothetical protein AFB00_02670 [Pseudonocardia sp. HH130630-07]